MMKRRFSAWILASVLGLTAFSAHAGTIDLKDFAFNVDGTFSAAAVPAGVDVSAFNMTTGLGIITATITGTGDHFFGGWFDHEIDQAINTPFNETGAAHGVLVAGQSWEIDEPGFGSSNNGSAGVPYFGDIYWNIENSYSPSYPGEVFLDDQVFYDWVDDQILTPPDDVSMAMGWEFTLADTEQMLIELVLSDTAPLSGFYLSQSDDTSPDQIFFSGSLIRSSIPAPEPSALLLFGAGLLGLGSIRRRKHTA
ncbi:MAG: PEP-CTERM sorting domain-containing protein [gamma proteobacterium endosymbiont of Lamellibrachia anaximandri]|nr:PEP-CTERM sorting domain-containing protein [gamma proteobacterium endosymbiont of Lamellibrachia anaximandri]MBL3534719.1 PEP-CTERM sorting domain-containing protein [gamma proteobacterium endosymbiont of Lamellibrachia anaximandri]